jgi:hypothetical protein
MYNNFVRDIRDDGHVYVNHVTLSKPRILADADEVRLVVVEVIIVHWVRLQLYLLEIIIQDIH